MIPLWPWIAFNAAVLAILAVDLGVFNRKAHAISLKKAALWSTLWITIALAFAGTIFVTKGHQAGVEFLTGYLIEYSLSVDNIFVFVLLFSFFQTGDEHQHQVLFWGILGALVMRGFTIALGTALITRFHWVTYVFGIFLIMTGARVAFQNEQELHPEANPILGFLKRVIPIWPRYEGNRFLYNVRNERGNVRWMATPLLVILVLIETMDLVFAVDSIPAVLAITRDPFIVYTSNVCAIFGLRSLYFLLAGVIHLFHYLKYGLSVVLVFVGGKMIATLWYEVPTMISLMIISSVLCGAVALSLAFPKPASEPQTRLGAGKGDGEVLDTLVTTVVGTKKAARSTSVAVGTDEPKQ